MVRSPCEISLKRGTWSPEEDHKLTAYIQRYGIWNWNHMAKFAGLSRSGKSCRLRWMNYLRPNIRRGNFSKAEEEIIIKMQQELGNRWSMIASRLPGRTDNEIKNFWNTRIRKHQILHKSPSPSPSSEILDTKTFVKFPEQRSKDGHDQIMIFPAKTCESSGLGLEEIIPKASSSSSSPQLSNLSYTSSSSTVDQAEVDTSTSSSTQPENNIIDHTFERFIEMGDLWEDPFQMVAQGLCMVDNADATHVQDWLQEPMNPFLLFDIDDIWHY